MLNLSSVTDSITDLEFGEMQIVADLALAAVRLEVRDPQGHGFTVLLGLPQALDATVRLIGAVSRLQRGGDGS